MTSRSSTLIAEPAVPPLPISKGSLFSLLLVMGALYYTSLYSFLLFHTLIELFSILVFFGIFVIAWNARRIIDNQYLLFLGIAYLFVGLIDLEHTLAYKGMEVLAFHDAANHATELWIAARYTESLALLLAPFFLQRKFAPRLVLSFFTCWTLLLLWTIHFGYFPNCFNEQSGLTPFKRASEYLISAILLASFLVLRKRRHLLHGTIYRLLAASIVLTICAELSFTVYSSVFGLSNVIGHFFKFLSAFLIYVALIENGLKKPYTLLFLELTDNQKILAAREAEFRSLFEMSAMGMVTIDPHSDQFIRVNKEFCRITGYDSDELTGLTSMQLTHPEDRQRDSEALRRFLQGENWEYRVEKRFIRKDGEVIWVRVSAATIHPETGGLLHLIEAVEDITTIKLLEKKEKRKKEELEREVSVRTAELARSVRQLRTLAMQISEAENRERRRIADILHDDLQQLLAAAGMHLRKLQSVLDPDQGRRLPVIVEILARAIKTSRSLSHDLSPAILYRGNLKEIFEWLAARKQESHGLTVTVSVPDNLHIESDALRVFLFRAVQELLFNIVKHSGTMEAAIAVDLQQNDTLLVLVADDGRGFEPENLLSSDHRMRNAGFGLFSIRERLHLLGGSLRIDSKPGHGSRFAIRLPLHEPDPKILPPVRQTSRTAPANLDISDAAVLVNDPPQDNEPIRIVLADDHETIRQGLDILLREERDLKVVGQAKNGVEAVTLAEKLRPDVMVMDMTMPEMDGLEATEKIAESWPEITVIAFSMHEDRELAAAAVAAGARAYCTKSDSTEKLLTVIRQFGKKSLELTAVKSDE